MATNENTYKPMRCAMPLNMSLMDPELYGLVDHTDHCASSKHAPTMYSDTYHATDTPSSTMTPSVARFPYSICFNFLRWCGLMTQHPI